MAKAQIILGELGGGSAEVVEGYALIRSAFSTGSQYYFNSTTNYSTNSSTDWVGDYLRFDNASGNIYAVQACKAMVWKNSDAPTIQDYAASDLIANASWNNISNNSAVTVLVLA